MPRTKGATNRSPRRVLVAARLPAEQAEWLNQNGTTETIEKLVEERMQIMSYDIEKVNDNPPTYNDVVELSYEIPEIYAAFMAARKHGTDRELALVYAVLALAAKVKRQNKILEGIVMTSSIKI